MTVPAWWRVAGAVLALSLAGPTVAAGSLSAQSATTASAPDTTVLTLDGALSVALGSNPAYRQAVNSAQLNGTEWRTTWFDQVLPQAQLNLFQTQYTGNLTRRATDNFGNPIERPVSDWNYFSQTNQSLDLTWNIQGSSIFNALDRQRLTNLDRSIAETRAQVEMEVGVRRAYWNALEQRDLLRAEEALLEARRLDHDVAERLFGMAMKTRVDVLNAELAVEQQQLALRQQRAAFQQALLALRTELGDDELGPFRLAETELPVFDPGTLDADGLVATARDVNPELRQARVAVRSADVGLSESKRAWWPQLFLNYRLARTVQTAQAQALFDVSFDEQLDQRFYVGVSIPMFTDYFQNQQSIHQSSVELQNSREEERAAELRTEQEVRGALLELENQHESLRLAERSAEIAAEALRLAREEYRLGSRSFEDLRAAFDREADTRRQVIEARHSFVDALLSLEEAVGTRLPGVRPEG
jgi:outer membrane protein